MKNAPYSRLERPAGFSEPTPIDRRAFLASSLSLLGLPLLSATGGCRAEEKKGGNEGWKIGCYTRPWADHDYRVALDEIAAAGFRYAGLMSTNSETRLIISVDTTEEESVAVGEEAHQRGLSIASVWGGKFNAAESFGAGERGLKRLIDNCQACGSPSLLLGGTAQEQEQEIYYKVVAACCDPAAEKKVQLVLKPHGGLNRTAAQCRNLVEQINHPSFRLWFDPGNILYYSDGKDDPVAEASQLKGIVTGMCVKDFTAPKNVNLTPGTGLVDFPAVFNRLNQGGFAEGALVVECLKPGNLEELREEAIQARQFLEDLTTR